MLLQCLQAMDHRFHAASRFLVAADQLGAIMDELLLLLAQAAVFFAQSLLALGQRLDALDHLQQAVKGILLVHPRTMSGGGLAVKLEGAPGRAARYTGGLFSRSFALQSQSTLPDWHHVQAALAPLQLAVSPSELHGALAGWVAGGGAVDGAWLGRTLADEGLVQPSDATLDALRDATVASMEDRELNFQLLLPDDDASVDVRGNALFDWCRSFLGGFGMAAGPNPPLSEEGTEALEDLAKLAMAEAESDGDEEDEAAFAEIEEFVRVASLLLHGDCALGPRHRKRLH